MSERPPRRAAGVALWACLMLIAAACTTNNEQGPAPSADTAVAGPGDQVPPGTTSPDEDLGDAGGVDTVPDVDDEPVRLVVWADDLRANVLEEAAGAFRDSTGVDVVVERLDIDDIRAGVADPAASRPGGPPDVFVGPSTWTGELAGAGLAVPIDLGSRRGDLIDATVDAFTFEGSVFAAPYSADALALFVNTDLVAAPPTTLEELVAICEGFADSADGVDDGLPGATDQPGAIGGCLGLPGGGDTPDAFHQYPFLAAFGGGVLAFDPGQGFALDTPVLDTDETIEGIELLAGLIEDGVIASTSYDDARAGFASGRLPFFITGPWEVGPLSDEPLDWSVVPLPSLDGGRLVSPVTAQGVFIGGQSPNPVIAQTFITDFVLTDDVLTALHAAEARPSPLRSIVEAEAGDPRRSAFNQAVATGVAFPNARGMGPVWDELGLGLVALRAGEASAAEAVQPAMAALLDLVTGDETSG